MRQHEKICLYYPGHMTKMTAMPMLSKNLSKVFFPVTKGLMV